MSAGHGRVGGQAAFYVGSRGLTASNKFLREGKGRDRAARVRNRSFVEADVLGTRLRKGVLSKRGRSHTLAALNPAKSKYHHVLQPIVDLQVAVTQRTLGGRLVSRRPRRGNETLHQGRGGSLPFNTASPGPADTTGRSTCHMCEPLTAMTPEVPLCERAVASDSADSQTAA
ncbi:hypothetical protein N658DRAFT_94608 [Parathielavia hyrcaniae]|uniref:Uncharacterized protein n=1 Tax=Parathielavia hyrcaniae TaxID=113614 RepID=A0AAN6T1M9_9PEZI|nr:hypothetical protein N658DRAFT_94608 [Parathielavia hyrcaniae]